MLALLELTIMTWWAGAFAFSGFVVTHILMKEGMILGQYARWIEHLPDWLWKPLGGCDYCFTGQLGFCGCIAILPLYDSSLWLTGKLLIYAIFCSLIAIFVLHIIKQIEDGH